MNEEIEVQNIYNEFELKAGVHIGTEERLIIQAIGKGFQKGKLEQKKEEFGDFVKWLDWLINSPKNTWSKQIKTKLEQLQKEIQTLKEDRSFLDGYAEFWDNPEDDRWDKEEEKQDDN